MTDIEIAKSVELKEITKIAEELEIQEYIEPYGKYKAKISNKIEKKLENRKNGKLILVTAISPTPLGEGKTTVSIAVADGLRKIGKKSILALREPSLGPVFGIKGGATGGGYVQVAPMEDINLHFTGDIHAITSANNLLSAIIDNHIYFGNELKIKEVVWKRCVDLNDRQLRKVNTGLSGESKIVPREDGFDITVASEIMAVVCLSKNIFDLKENLSKILVGYNEDNKPIYVKDLKAEGAMAVLLKDAIKPNLVQTLEHTPAIIHGGPFANIAHGCNSIIATQTALKLADYTVTEAGFGADLGAEKFLDIKCRRTGLKPDAVVLVATIKALKYHGGVPKEDIQKENINALEKGLGNIYKHIENLKENFGLNVIVALNKYNSDTTAEIEFLKQKVEEKGVEFSVVEGWAKGGQGATDIANKLVELTNKPSNLKFTYNDEDDIKTKIEKVC
ncbi:MAG: formate--tetrahydrofolate ligase, partial [Clostridia bacterium]|nr:formate--tetrahydrofolate ligase [Clostridia bacterium]